MEKINDEIEISNFYTQIDKRVSDKIWSRLKINLDELSEFQHVISIDIGNFNMKEIKNYSINSEEELQDLINILKDNQEELKQIRNEFSRRIKKV